MASPKDPFQVLSSDNRGPIITLVSVSLLIVAIIFVLAKFGTAIYFKQRRSAVNTPIWIALVLAIAQVVVLQKAVDHGLGRHAEELEPSEGDVQAWSKFAFAAQILLILVLALSKLSTVLLVWKLIPSGSLRRSCVVIAGVVVAWTVFAVLGFAFQCALPQPWVYLPERCAGEGAIFYPIAVVNVLTELVLVVQPFIMMRNVQMAWRKRVKILCSFSTRICVVGLAIAHLALLPSFVHSSDVSWDIVNWQILGQTMMLTTVIIACVPTLYHIFAGLHSGLTTTQIPDGIGVELSHSKAKGSGYINQSSSDRRSQAQSHSQSQSQSQSQSRGRSRQNGRSLFDPRGSDTTITTEVSTFQNRNRNTGDRESSSSEGAESTRHLTQDTAGKGGVLRTVDITVEIEVEEGHNRDHRDRL
ncbi:hypothetical protein BJX70DRAFT_365131 [Aspergillus crustosus]